MPQTLRPGIPSAFRGNSDLRSAQCASHRADYFCGFSQLTTLKTRSAPPSHHARQRVAFLRQLYTLLALRGFSGLACWTTTRASARQLLSSSSYSGVRRGRSKIDGSKSTAENGSGRRAASRGLRSEQGAPGFPARRVFYSSKSTADFHPSKPTAGLLGTPTCRDPWRAGAKALGGYI